MENLDVTDRAIIKIFNENARASSAHIARLLNIPDSAVRNRIIRLIHREIVKPIGVVNPSDFVYQLAVDTFCELETGA